MIIKKLQALALIFLAFLVHAQNGAANDSSQIIFQAMEQEMSRSLQELKIDVFDLPYFIRYQIRHHDRVEIAASFGALTKSSSDQKRTLFVDVRVGSPKFDSSTPGSHRHSIRQFIPLDNDLDALKRAIWKETDVRYKQAVINFLKKKGRLVSGIADYNLPDFSRGQFPIVQVNPTPEVVVDFAEWENLARTISVHFKKIPEIEKSRVLIFADRSIRYYLDSEGNKLRETALHYGVTLEAWSKTKLGYTVEDQETLFFTDPAQIPSRQQLAAKAEQLIAGILALRSAPKMEPFVGPALFSPDATAMLFHEAIGHRLEGDRLRTNNDGKTFAKKIGRHILPSFLSIVDNPTVRRFNGEELLGHYEFDDDGQRGQEVVLIEQGALKNFLLSRNPAPGFNKTNGHARSDGLRFPISRMSNFFIRSDQKAEPEQLKQRLIEEIKRQNKPYGIMIKKMLSGETQTHKDFQVFKGTPLYVYKVYPEDGREELVQGVEFVGTPLSMINKVILTGKDDAVLNAYCGAESGFILVTSVAPSILLSEVELQSSQGPRLRLPILPPPIIHD